MVYSQTAPKSLFRSYVGKIAIAIIAIAISVLSLVVWTNGLTFVRFSARAEAVDSLPFVVTAKGVPGQIQDQDCLPLAR